MRSFVRISVLAAMYCFVVSPVYAQWGIFDQLADWEGRGSIKVPGNVQVDGEGLDAVYDLWGNGDDIWENTDEGLFVYTERAGSWSLQARVEWLDPGTNEWSKVGVMVREKGDVPNSQHYWIILRGNSFGDLAGPQWRTTEGGSSGWQQAYFPEGSPFAGAPVDSSFDGTLWLRVTRIAPLDLVYSEFSEDGETWYVAHSQMQPMQDVVSYGLVITDHTDTNQLAHAQASSVALYAPPTVAARSFSHSAFGPGDSVQVSITVLNSGDSADAFSVRETAPAGWAVNNISHGGTLSNNVISWNIDAEPGETTLSYVVTAPDDVDSAASFSGEAGALGVLGASALAFERRVTYGIFDRLADWESRGSIKVEGSVEVEGEGEDAVYTLAGNGDDIWDNTDEGLFLYTERAGSWSLQGRVEWIEPGTNEWSKIGVMVREKGAVPNSQHYWVMLRGNQMGDLAGPQWRTTEGGSSDWTQAYFPEGSPFAGAPFDSSFDGTLWLRVTRLADTQEVFSEISEDGDVWYEVHRLVQPMQDIVAYGLVITDHTDTNQLAIARVSNVVFTQLGEVSVTDWTLY